ncbi:MAG: SDR family oxidoreductase [Candidatus Bipolaricaulia bacterium]
MTMDAQGKGTALVTGAAKRVGRAIALTLAENGYNIALHYRGSSDDAQALARKIEEVGREYHLFRSDFNDMKDVAALIPAVFDVFPDCNLLVNNASIFQRAPLVETDEQLFDRHFNINLKTPFFLSRDFARHLQGQEGQIVNILDTKITKNFTEYFVYTLTKKALFEFTKMAAKELGPHIRVNGVCPGLILPPPGKDKAYLDQMSQRIPLQRKGDPESVASAVSFLVGHRFITGEWIFVDGGEHLI